MRARIAPVILAVVLTALAIGSTRADGQTPRERNPVPLERPRPLVIATGAPRDVLQKIHTILRRDGFSVDAVNWNEGDLEASRTSARRGGGDEAMDKVIVWLERSLTDSNQVRVYFEYGRYERFFGYTDLQRIALSRAEERALIGPVRDDVASAELGRP